MSPIARTQIASRLITSSARRRVTLEPLNRLSLGQRGFFRAAAPWPRTMIGTFLQGLTGGTGMGTAVTFALIYLYCTDEGLTEKDLGPIKQ